jgi:hypothetical protein
LISRGLLERRRPRNDARMYAVRIRAADGSVVELTDDVEARPLGAAQDGRTLALVAVLVGRRRW